MNKEQVRFFREEATWQFHFSAMASPCSILLEGCDKSEAQGLAATLIQEVRRIEAKYSRYRNDSILSVLNQRAGETCAVDPETLQLLNLATLLWQQSNGRFDISSGVLRKVWNFSKNENQHPISVNNTAQLTAEIAELMQSVGWSNVVLEGAEFTMSQGMQIDFGGIGKEYAADRCAALAKEPGFAHCLINLGGDVVATGKRANGELWRVGIESQNIESTKQADSGQPAIWRVLPLGAGAIATSGDTHRYLWHEGKRYGHIIDARTGWPVENAPASVTVAAPSATEAGMLTTLALLQGANAEEFLKQQQRPYWIQQQSEYAATKSGEKPQNI